MRISEIKHNSDGGGALAETFPAEPRPSASDGCTIWTVDGAPRTVVEDADPLGGEDRERWADKLGEVRVGVGFNVKDKAVRSESSKEMSKTC